MSGLRDDKWYYFFIFILIMMVTSWTGEVPAGLVAIAANRVDFSPFVIALAPT